MDLIHRLELSVLRHPDREFLVDGPLRLTYADWDRRVNRAAWAYRSLGVGRGTTSFWSFGTARSSSPPGTVS